MFHKKARSLVHSLKLVIRAHVFPVTNGGATLVEKCFCGSETQSLNLLATENRILLFKLDIPFA